MGDMKPKQQLTNQANELNQNKNSQHRFFAAAFKHA